MKLAKTKLEMLCVWENIHCSIIMDGGRMYWLYVAFLSSQEPGCIVKGRGNHSRKTPRVQAFCHFLFHQPSPVAFVHMVTRSTCLQALSPSPKQEERQGKNDIFPVNLEFPFLESYLTDFCLHFIGQNWATGVYPRKQEFWER